MKAIALLEKQLVAVNSALHSGADDLTEQEWVSRSRPGQNMVGFIVWHLPRVQDSSVQTWIRGVPEVVHGDRWAHWRHLKPLGEGVGITLEEADRIAQSVQRVDVLEYADTVHHEILTWLRGLTDDDLDQIPEVRKHLSPYPEYQTPAYQEANDCSDQPIWYLLGPCIGHIRGHLGELQAVKDILRAGQ